MMHEEGQKHREGQHDQGVLDRADGIVVAGLAMLWPSLHASPYFPFSLISGFVDMDLGAISAQHVLYSVLLTLVLIAIAAAGNRTIRTLAHNRVLTFGVGAAGAVGCILLMATPTTSAPSDLVHGIAATLVACYVGLFLTMWLATVCTKGHKRVAVIIALSYCLFSGVWTVVVLLGNLAVSVACLLCCVGSTVCLASCRPSVVEADAFADRPSASHAKALPWAVIALCAVFIYFGVIGVRSFTTMTSGELVAGRLPALPQAVTFLTSLAIAAGMAIICRRRGLTNSTTVSMLALITLVYMGALLMVMLGSPDGAGLYGKRILVGAEHSFEILLFTVLAQALARRHGSVAFVSGTFGIFVCVVPQFIALDVLYRSGLMSAMSSLSLVMPIAAIAAFVIAALVIGLMVSYTARTATHASTVGDAWQTDLCRMATAGSDITPAEFDVVLYTYRGYSAKKTAETLLVSESTVKTHLTHIYRKLGIHTKQELIDLVDSYREQ